MQGVPLLQHGMLEELIDPRLVSNYVQKQVKSMMHAAELCLLLAPERRPRMSQVSFLFPGCESTIIFVFLSIVLSSSSNLSAEKWHATAGSENTGGRYAQWHGKWVQATISLSHKGKHGLKHQSAFDTDNEFSESKSCPNNRTEKGQQRNYRQLNLWVQWLSRGKRWLSCLRAIWKTYEWRISGILAGLTGQIHSENKNISLIVVGYEMWMAS